MACFWVDGLGLNPLEFPGRSAVVLPNTAGLILTAVCLAIAFVMATRASRLWTRTPAGSGLVMSIVPIALAYHFAHYLADFPVDALRALKALSGGFQSAGVHYDGSPRGGVGLPAANGNHRRRPHHGCDGVPSPLAATGLWCERYSRGPGSAQRVDGFLHNLRPLAFVDAGHLLTGEDCCLPKTPNSHS